MEIRTLASGSHGNAYYINDSTTPLLLDCGVGYRQIQTALDFKTRQLRGCLVTHEHQDHARAVPGLLQSRIPVFMTQGTKEALKLPDKHSYAVNIIQAEQPFALNTWQALPFETYHDAAQPVGYLLASTTGVKLLYATDTHFIGLRFRGVTHLMIEANYCEDILAQNIAAKAVHPSLANRLYDTHLNLRRVKEFLLTGNWEQLQEIHLLHLSHQNADPEAFKREIQQLTGLPVYIAGETTTPGQSVSGPEVKHFG